MNKFYHDELIINISKAISSAKAAKNIEHAFLIGRIREIVLDHLIRPILPFHISIGTGKITNVNGDLSNEIDLIIYAKNLIAPIFYSERLGIYPCESVLACIEVKSELNNTEINKTIKNFNFINQEKFQATSGYYDKKGRPNIHGYMSFSKCLFAFSSDLSTKTELDRYKENDNNWDKTPCLHSLCVVGKSFHINHGSATKANWLSVQQNSEYQEVIAFLRCIADYVIGACVSRGNPHYGGYFIGDDKFGL